MRERYTCGSGLRHLISAASNMFFSARIRRRHVERKHWNPSCGIWTRRRRLCDSRTHTDLAVRRLYLKHDLLKFKFKKPDTAKTYYKSRVFMWKRYNNHVQRGLAQGNDVEGDHSGNAHTTSSRAPGLQ